MAKYGHAAMMMRKREAAQGKPPKGFDIDLMQVMAEYNLSDDKVKLLGELTVDRKIASATIGHNVYYRRRQIEETLDVKQAEVH